jgi:aldehyde dehydrogenase family 7 protein A1
MIWKGAESTSLVAIATTKIVADVMAKNGFKSVLTLCQGLGPTIGSKIVNDPRVALVSFTGSTAVGRHVATQVQKRFGKSVLELGGNNAAIIMDDADPELALKACVFAAVGTCGQRCTSLRRIYVHESLYDKFVERMVNAYKTIKIGSPLENGTLCGPLHNKNAVKFYEEGIKKIKEQGGNILVGGNIIPGEGNYVEPTIVEMKPDAEIL